MLSCSKFVTTTDYAPGSAPASSQRGDAGRQAALPRIGRAMEEPTSWHSARRQPSWSRTNGCVTTCVVLIPTHRGRRHTPKGSLVEDPNEDAATPELLVYQPQENGRLRLVALEYVVLQSAWPLPARRVEATQTLARPGSGVNLPTADVADIVAFLAAADGRWMTGQICGTAAASYDPRYRPASTTPTPARLPVALVVGNPGLVGIAGHLVVR